MINVHSNISIIFGVIICYVKKLKFLDYNCLYCLSIITLEGLLPIVAHSRMESAGHHSRAVG